MSDGRSFVRVDIASSPGIEIEPVRSELIIPERSRTEPVYAIDDPTILAIVDEQNQRNPW